KGSLSFPRFLPLFEMLWFLCLLPLASGRVTFTYSVLLDGVDYNTDRKLQLPFCSQGCSIYAATNEGQNKFSDGLLITADNGQFATKTMTSAMYDYDPQTGAKKPCVLQPLAAGQSYFIENTNKQGDSALMTVYVVAIDAPNQDKSLVYDVMQNYPAFSKNIITILTNLPQNIKIAPSSKKNSVVVRTVGFDNADGHPDNCPFVFDSDSHNFPFPGLSLPINSPIYTLTFDTASDISLTSYTLISTSLYLDPKGEIGYMSSPGYVGCSKNGQGMQALRSSNYNSETYYRLNSAGTKMNIHFTSYMQTPQDYPVIIQSNYKNTSLWGVRCDASELTQSDFTATESLALGWTRVNDMATFMIRYEASPSTPSSTNHAGIDGSMFSLMMFSVIAILWRTS
ncbi:hypothetical protein PFISCL1PPCAC_18780, partial [Pristionchus fissidentatus]